MHKSIKSNQFLKFLKKLIQNFSSFGQVNLESHLKKKLSKSGDTISYCKIILQWE